MIEALSGTVIKIGPRKRHASNYYYYNIDIRLDAEWNRKVLVLHLREDLSNYQPWSTILLRGYGLKTRVEGMKVLANIPNFVNKDVIPKIIAPKQVIKQEPQRLF